MNSSIDINNPIYNKELPKTEVLTGRDTTIVMDNNAVEHGVFFWYDYTTDGDMPEVFNISWAFISPADINNFPKNEISAAFEIVVGERLGNCSVEDEMRQRV